MPRRKITEKRTINPDPRFNSILVTKFTNGIMETGKKSLAQRIFYGAMDIIEQQVSDQEPIAVFDKAMEKVRPKVEVNPGVSAVQPTRYRLKYGLRGEMLWQSGGLSVLQKAGPARQCQKNWLLN